MGLLGTNGLAPQGQMNLYRLICDMANSILQEKTEEILSETTNLVDAYWEKPNIAKGVLFGVKESVLFHKKEIRLQSDWKISV
jgi:ABC-2 type transport system ATP-binding protein